MPCWRPPPAGTPAIEDWTADAIRDATVAAGEDAGVPKPREAQAPIRLAVMGRAVGLPLWESLRTLGRDATLARLADARSGCQRLTRRRDGRASETGGLAGSSAAARRAGRG